MVSPTHSVSTLRTHLLSPLSTLPGHRLFNLHVLVSSQRKPNESLFPYLSPKPKHVMQDVLILLSERVPPTEDGEDASPAVFVAAIEADIYFFPSSVSTILYISKVDGTGQGLYPSPTSTLVNALLQFYASATSPIYPTDRNHTLWVHLFARAQRQYLFPNSADYPDKKPLGDVALCRWWKKSFGKAMLDILRAYEMLDPLRKERMELSARLFYIIPGQSESEALYSLGLGNVPPTEAQWTYSHPYDVHNDLDIPFVTASPDSEIKQNYLPSLIPYFDDDPKSRFLDELAATNKDKTIAVPTPTPKRRKRKHSSSRSRDGRRDGPSNDVPACAPAPPQNDDDIQMPQPEVPDHPFISIIPASSSPPRVDDGELIERPSTPEPDLEEQFLQAPQTPQFPRLTAPLLSPHTPQNNILRAPTNTAQLTLRSKISGSPHTPKSPRRPKSDLDTVTTTEFWERMSFRQECAQSAVTGFFTAIFAQKSSVANGKQVDLSEAAAPSILVNGTVPHTIIKRIMTSLLTGVEFSTVERSRKGTQIIENLIKGLCDGLHDFPLLEKSGVPGIDDGIYTQHVHATLTVNNPPIIRKQLADSLMDGGPPVNILGVRRKKKRDQ